ncbi:hypothetical protein HAX54_012427 [Datura stramonium]|uniref:Uncharacterized protein n=1 Tax=Datura stramonium TaxID=4076 RepID=A0ABS8TJQ5_DATST|nr:hypothetical protein [Datura stramonium]
MLDVSTPSTALTSIEQLIQSARKFSIQLFELKLNVLLKRGCDYFRWEIEECLSTAHSKAALSMANAACSAVSNVPNHTLAPCRAESQWLRISPRTTSYASVFLAYGL